jgi:PII-like signaling protein
VNDDCLKLTVYYGERDRVGRGFLADALVDVFARHELQTSLVMRGVTGFGVKQHLRTDRLLTLSEDLPLVSVAVDTRARIEAALHELEALRFDGLVTLERARMVGGEPLRADRDEATKLTVYVGRGERVGRIPAYEAVVALMHRRGVAGASVLLGVDGTAHGVRRRARFLARNADVPSMVIAVGDGMRIGTVLPELGAMLPRPLVTLERVTLCKRDGERLAEPRRALGAWVSKAV